MEAGLLVRLAGAIVEFAVALTAYMIAKRDETLYGWLKLFAVGVVLHGVSLLTEQLLVTKYIIGAVTPTIRATGLVLIFYSLLKGVGSVDKRLIAIIIASALYFIIGVTYVLLTHPPEGPIHLVCFDIPHVLLVIIMPLLVAGTLYKVYAESGDKSALIFSVGMIIYALAMILGLLAIHLGMSMLTMLIIKDALWTTAFIVILSAFFVV